MSSGAQVAVLGSARFGRREGVASARHSRGSVTLVAFCLLGGYGVLRWSTMLASPPAARLLGLVGLSLVVAALGGGAHRLRSWPRAAALAGTAVAALAMIPMSGFPLGWALHLRIAVQARAIGDGLGALPGVLVPYAGHQRATGAVIALGAGMLLLGAALTLATRPRGRPAGEVRLAAAALPLTVLAVVPSALSRPSVADLHGLLLFALLVLFVFSERVQRPRAYAAIGLAALAAAGALVVVPALEGGSAWISFQTIVRTAVAARGENFDWAQTYGPLVWPHNGGTVLDVRARLPDYWKTEDLDQFDGHGWVAAPVTGDPLAGVRASSTTRWTQLITVTVRGMHSSQVIAAGTAYPPVLSGGQPVQGGSAPGTYVTQTPLEPGDSYQVRVYTPHPDAAQLAGAGEAYPLSAVAPELQLELSPGGSPGGVPAQPFQFAPYGAVGPLAAYGGLSAARAYSEVTSSAYGPVFALAQHLKAGTSTPYQYVEAVLARLAHGYSYDQNPPLSPDPLLSFLFGNHLGYCQQFAGAMALLLRMGGVPARVATGFATGTYDPAGRQFIVDDFDAHAWVEAWFPGYGWVKFDPTPTSDPALGGHVPLGAGQAQQGHAHLPAAPATHTPKAAAAATAGRRPSASSSSGPWTSIAVVLGAALLLAAVAILARRRRRPAGGDALLVELERALARCGRPLPAQTTLAGLERRFADSDGAAAYVRALRQARYAAAAEPPTAAQRRALRGRLRRGLGALGWIRALTAVPPRRRASRS